MINALKRWLPEPLRARIRQNNVWRRRYDRRHAQELATGSKRLDLCAAQIAHLLQLAKSPRLEGKVCLEVGCGWILTHALVCHLLGAKKVIASDVAPMAHPSYIRTAVRQAVPYIVRDVLSPFCEHSEIRRRLDHLLSIDVFTFEVLEELGIEYVGAIDLAERRLDIGVDFIYSLSVLEHVPAEDVPALLRNLAADLEPGGAMIHAIHLEDHRDIQNRPFSFLAAPAASYGRHLQTEHGNRIRRSEWRRLFDQVADLESRFIYEFSRRDKALPERIDTSIAHEGEADLRISHLGVHGIKAG